MSERGSFCTEYIYCAKCFEIVGKYLYGKSSHLCSQPIRSWEGGYLPIIAGKIGGLYSNEEIETICTEVAPKIAKEICHNVRIVILASSGTTAIFNLKPSPDIDLEKEIIEPIETVRKDQIDQSKNLDWLAVQAKALGWVLRPISQEERQKSNAKD